MSGSEKIGGNGLASSGVSGDAGGIYLEEEGLCLPHEETSTPPPEPPLPPLPPLPLIEEFHWRPGDPLFSPKYLDEQKQRLRELPADLTRDPSYGEIQRDDPAWARSLERVYESTIGPKGPDQFQTGPEEGEDPTLEELSLFLEARIDEFSKKVEARRKAEYLRSDDFKNRQEIFTTVARYRTLATLANHFSDPSGILITEKGCEQVRQALDEELRDLPDRLKKSLTPLQLKKISREFQQIRERLELFTQDSIYPLYHGEPDRQIALNEEQAQFLGELLGKVARYESFALNQALQRQKATLDPHEPGTEISKRLNQKLSSLFASGRSLETDSVVQTTHEILSEIDHQALKLSLKNEVEVITQSQEAIRKTYADLHSLEVSGLVKPKNYDQALKILHQCQELMDSGQEEEARKRFIRFTESEFHTDLVRFLTDANQHVVAKEMVQELVKGVAIVSIAALTGQVAVAVFEPYLAGTALGTIGLALIEGSTFVLTEKTLSHRPGTDFLEGKSTGEKIEHLARDIAFTSALFPYLKTTGKISRELAQGLLKFGETGKVLVQLSGFLGELIAFTAWEQLEGNARLALDGRQDLVGVSERVLSLEGTFHRVLFLGALKLGHFVSKPISVAVRQKGLQRQIQRLEKIHARAEQINRFLALADLTEPENVKLLEPTFRELLQLQREKVRLIEGIQTSTEGKGIAAKDQQEAKQALKNAEQFLKTARSLSEGQARSRVGRFLRDTYDALNYAANSGALSFPAFQTRPGTTQPQASLNRAGHRNNLPLMTVRATPPVETPRTGTPVGVVFGGFTTIGYSHMIPRDGSLVEHKYAQSKATFRYNTDLQRYEYQKPGENWQPMAIGQPIRIGEITFNFVEFQGVIEGDMPGRHNDLMRQVAYQLATEGVQHHLLRLRGQDRIVTEEDAENLSLFFTENFEGALKSFSPSDPGRTAGGLYGGTTQVCAFVDRESGQIIRFADDGPTANEIKQAGHHPGHRRFILKPNPNDGNRLYWSERQLGFFRPVSLDGVPESAVPIQMTFNRMTGQVMPLERAKLVSDSLSEKAVQRMENLGNAFVRVGGATLQAGFRYGGGKGRDVVTPSPSPRAGQTLTGIGPVRDPRNNGGPAGQIPPVAPLSILTGPMLFWRAYKDGTLGQAAQRAVDGVRRFFANAYDALNYAANSEAHRTRGGRQSDPEAGFVEIPVPNRRGPQSGNGSGWDLISRLATLEQLGVIDEKMKAELDRLLNIPGARRLIIDFIKQNTTTGQNGTLQLGGNSIVHFYSRLKGLLFELSRNERASRHFGLTPTATRQRRKVTVRAPVLKKNQEASENGRRESVWSERESPIQIDVPIIAGHIYETKSHLGNGYYGSSTADINQVLRYQRAIEEGHFQGGTIEVRGKVYPAFIDFLRERCPDLELLYLLELPSGQEVAFVIKPAREGRRSLERFPDNSILTEPERHIIEGIKKRLSEGTIAEIFTDNLLTEADIAGSSYEAELRGALENGRLNPARLGDSIGAFKEFERLSQVKRLRLVEGN